MSMPVKKSKGSRSLAATLAIAFLILGVVILVIASSIIIFFNLRTQRETIASEQQLIAQEAANAVASFIQEKFSVLETAAKLEDLTFTSAEEQKNALGDLLGFDRAFRQLILFDSQNRDLVKVSRISQIAADRLMDQLEDDLFTQVGQGNRYISPVYIDELTSEPIVVMAVPIIDNFGDFQGTLLAEVNLKFMWDLVERLEIGQAGQAYVVDRHGNLIAFYDIARVLRGENVSHLKEVAEYISNPMMVDEDGASIARGIEGNLIVGTYVPLGTPDWAVVTELPVREAYGEVILGIGISVLVMVAMAILTGLIGVYVARRLAVPLRNLTETATQIAEGELDLEAAVEGPTEVTLLATAFNSMTTQLHELIGSLEQRVADRTQRLEILATLSERLTAILDFEQLLTELVNQVKERFDYYHAHVYILDDNHQNLVMAAGAGQAGTEMKARGHHIFLDAPTSLVARAARTGEIVWVDNVREAEDWLSNPLLPDTYSEMAVPIILEGQVVGVLDVQEDEVAGLDESDASLLRFLANQVAVAIRNAHLFTEVEAALADARAAQGQYFAQAWKKVKTKQKGAEFQYHRAGTELLDGAIITQLEQEAMKLGQAAVVAIGNNSGGVKPGRPELGAGDEEIDHLQEAAFEAQNQTALVTPIRLHNQTIGTIQLAETEGQHQWNDMELALVQDVANQVAQAAENLRLFEETRQRASREQTIRQITENIRTATSLDEVIKRAADELGQYFSAKYAFVKLGLETPAEDSNQQANEHD